MSAHPFILPSLLVCMTLCASSSVYLAIRIFRRLCCCLSVRTSSHPSLCIYILPSLCPSVYIFMYLFIYYVYIRCTYAMNTFQTLNKFINCYKSLLTCLSIYMPIYVFYFIYLCIHVFIYPSMYLQNIPASL
jgi:hypothetical protein